MLFHSHRHEALYSVQFGHRCSICLLEATVLGFYFFMLMVLKAIVTGYFDKLAFSSAGIQVDFSSHSFPISKATVANCNGVPGHLI